MFLVIFPRSGTHLMLHIFRQQFDYVLPSFHHIKEAKQLDGKIISVVRDPYEAIHSACAMRAYYGQEEAQDDLIRYYVELHDYLYNRADIVIDYNTLVNSQDETRDYLQQALKLKYNGNTYMDVAKDKPDKKYLVTTVGTEFYDVDFLKGYDLSRAYESYNRLISRKDVYPASK